MDKNIFASLFQFELRYQVKQITFITLSIALFLLGALLSSNGYVIAQVNLNAPYQIAFNVGLISIGCPFVIMFLVTKSLLRDHMYKMESIVFSTTLPKSQFFWTKFAGVFCIATIIITLFLVGFAVGFLSPLLDPERITKFELAPYMITWLVFILPNVFICSSIIFTIGALTKNQIAIFSGAILLYFLYWVASIYFNSPLLAQSVPSSSNSLSLAALADPFGMSAYFEQTQFWTPFQKNVQIISLTGTLLWNRIFWIAIALIILTFTYVKFSFKIKNTKDVKPKPLAVMQEYVPTSYSSVQDNSPNYLVQWNRYYSLVKSESRQIFKSLPFQVLLFIWIISILISIYERVHQGGIYNDSLYPTTSILLDLIQEPIFSLLLLMFFSGEIIWKVKELKFDEILESTPTSRLIFLLAKFTTLILLPFIVAVLGSLFCVLFQVFQGYYHFEPLLYLTSTLLFACQFIFYAIVALLVQSLANSKYLGIGLFALLMALFSSFISNLIGIEHPMLRLGKLPEISYTDMNGYSRNTKSFMFYLFYWISLGLIFGLVTFKTWSRGKEDNFKTKMRRLIRNWNSWEIASLVISILAFIVLGSIIYYRTNVLNNYQGIEAQLNIRAAYEKKYKKFEELSELVIIDVNTKMDIYPEQNKYEVEVVYILENRTQKEIDQILVTERLPLDQLEIEGSESIVYDDYLMSYMIEFNQPVLPGEQRFCKYSVVKKDDGFSPQFSILKNGSYITQHQFKPTLGYRKSLEIKDNFERSKQGLEPIEVESLSDEHLRNHQYHNMVPIHFRTIVSTSKNQIAIAPGDLINQWTESDRSYFEYQSNEKILESIAYFSAKYRTKKIVHKGISIEQFFHSGHEYNIQNTENIAKLALDYCIQNFGLYPYSHLRIAEIPGHWPFGGQAMPGTISMVGDRFYLIDNRDNEAFDLVAKRTIHEIAHQWWGMLLRPKIIEGASLLVEGLAKYTEAVIMEKEFGKGALWQLSESANTKYFSERSFAEEPEPPIIFEDGEGYLSYGKNLTILLALKEVLGEESLNAVLKDMVYSHRNDMTSTATSIEFYEAIMQIAPPQHIHYIEGLFKKVIVYDLRIKDISHKLIDEGYEITVSISANRYQSNKQGEEIEIPINEPITLGMFSKHPKQLHKNDALIYLKLHVIDKSNMEFKIVVSELPKYVVLDPFGAKSEKNRLDNLIILD